MEKLEKQLSISQFAKIQNVSRKALIFYDREGIFQPSYREPRNGYRYYNISKIYEFDQLRTFIETGVPLDNIKKYKSSNTSIHDYFEIQKTQVALLKKNKGLS